MMATTERGHNIAAFFHPDCTVGSGFSPDLLTRLA